MDVLGPLGKAQLTVDDDPPMPFWEALEAKKWGLRKVRLILLCMPYCSSTFAPCCGLLTGRI